MQRQRLRLHDHAMWVSGHDGAMSRCLRMEARHNSGVSLQWWPLWATYEF